MMDINNLLNELNAKSEFPWTPLYTQDGTETIDDPGSMGYWALASTIFFTMFVYIFENYLNQRQLQTYNQTEFPKQLEITVQKIDSESKTMQDTSKSTNEEKDSEKPDRNAPLLPQLRSKFTKSQSYGKDKMLFGMFSELYGTAETILFLLLGFLPYMWDTAKQIGDNQYFRVEGEIGISLIFLLLVTVIGMVTSLPFELYSTFRIEKKHGFNKMTSSLFVSDKMKGLVLTIAIGGPFTALLLKIIQIGGDKFYLYVWAFMSVFSIFMMTIYPLVIMPMFNKYDTLPDGELKKSIYTLADKVKYPLTNLFVMDGSKRSSHSNAFMFGFGSNKRIVLFDTLLDQVSNQEILAILGHELGHWKLGHTLSNFVITQLYTGAMFYGFSLCFKSLELFSAFGFSTQESIPSIIALLVYTQTLWAPVDKCLSFILTVFSRHNEFGADEFSLNMDMSRDLQSGLCKIHLENLGAMCPDKLYSAYHYSHPPLVERLGRMMELDAKKK